jgi:integrase
MKRFKVETKIKKPVTLEWINAFRAAADRLDIGTLALFLFATGARVSEALSVRWGDIDFRKRTVLIRASKIGAERLAHLPPSLFVALASLRRDKEPFQIAYTTARDAWDRTVKAAGIEPLTFHSCRHGFATAMDNMGVGVKDIAELGGWKSVQTLWTFYLHGSARPTMTDRLFDTSSDTAKTEGKQDQKVKAAK